MPFRAVWCDDWSVIQPFSPDAANKPIFLITKRGENQGTETPGGLWERVPGVQIKKTSWRELRPKLKEELGKFAPVTPSVPTSAWSFQHANRPALIAGGSTNYTFGVGVHTRGGNGIFFVDVKSPKPAAGAKKATVKVTNDPSEGRNDQVQKTTGTVESELVYPVLRGRDVTHWVAKPSAYMMLAHDPADMDRALPAKKFKDEYPNSFQWLSRHKKLLAVRKAPPTRSWDMSSSGDDWARVEGPLTHMTSGHLVVVRELAHRPAAALVETRMDTKLGGRKVTPIVDHKLMFCSTKTRDEALYLVAMINSTPMQDLLASFINTVAVGPKALSRLPIPDFDPDNATMRALVALADAIVSSADPTAEATTRQSELDALVLKIVHAAKDYEPQPQKAKRAPRKKTPTESGQDAFDLPGIS